MPKPFKNEIFTFSNPDGSTVQVRGWGNQYHAVFESLDGYTVIKNSENGFYEYARLSPNEDAIEPSGIRVGEKKHLPATIKKHIRVKSEIEKRNAVKAVKQLDRKPRWKTRYEEWKHMEKSRIFSAGSTGAPETAPPPGQTVGDYVGLCLLIQFPDVSATINRNEVLNFCNQQGYNNFDNNESVYDYFHDISDGKLRYTNIVTSYYTAGNNRSYYTNNAISFGTRARDLITEVLDHMSVLSSRQMHNMILSIT